LMTLKIPVVGRGLYNGAMMVRSLTSCAGWLAVMLLTLCASSSAMGETDKHESVEPRSPQQTIAAPGAYHAVRLSDGGTLISCGKMGKLIKVDGKGEAIWQLSAKDVPEAGLETVGQIQAMVNGDVVVANHSQSRVGRYVLFRVNAEKTVVWKIKGGQDIAGVSAFQLTDYDPRIRVRR